MVCSCVLYYDETIIHYVKLFLPFSSELFLPFSSELFLRTVVIITACLCSLYTGGPEWTLIIKIGNKHYFVGRFLLNFVKNIS